MAADKPIPDPTSAGADARSTRRRDDTERFLERFAALTGMRAQSASIEGLPREFLARTVPPPKALLEQHGFALEARTYNALCRYEPGPENQPWTFARLLEIRGFGVFSLLDLLEVLSGQAKGRASNSPLT